MKLLILYGTTNRYQVKIQYIDNIDGHQQSRTTKGVSNIQEDSIDNYYQMAKFLIQTILTITSKYR